MVFLPRSRRRRLVLPAALMAAGGLVFLLLGPPWRVEPALEPPAPMVEDPGVHRTTAAEAPRNGDRPLDPGTGARRLPEPLDPKAAQEHDAERVVLTESNRKRLRASLLQNQQNDWRRYHQFLEVSSRQDEFDIKRIEKEAELLFYKTASQANLRIFDEGDFLALEGVHGINNTEEYIATMIPFSQEGTSYTLVLKAYMRDHPELASAREYREHVRRQLIAEHVHRFNGLPLGTRRAKLQRYDELLSLTSRNHQQMTELRSIVPRGVRVDRRGYFLRWIE